MILIELIKDTFKIEIMRKLLWRDHVFFQTIYTVLQKYECKNGRSSVSTTV